MNIPYNSYYKTQLEDGQLFQDFVVDVAWQAGLAIVQYASRAYQLKVGESRGGVEIKHDKNYKRTGNLYIEYAEKAKPRPGPYVPSGIMRQDHWLYAIGDYDIVFMFPSNILRALRDANGRYRHVEKPTSQGFLIPDDDAQKYAALILRPNASGKISQMTGDLERLAADLHAAVKADPNQLTLFNNEPEQNENGNG